MTVTNVSVLWVTNWKMETITTVRTLTNVKRRVINAGLIKYVQILTDLTIVCVSQVTEKSNSLNARTLMSVLTAIMVVIRSVITHKVDLSAHVKKAMKEQMTHVRVSNGFIV